VGPAGRPPVAVRTGVQSKGIARLSKPPRKRRCEQGQLVQEGMNGFNGSRLEYDAKKPARAGKIPFPDRVAGMVLEGRMEYVQYFGRASNQRATFMPEA